MPKASRKTKGSTEGRTAPCIGLAGEDRQACQPSTGRIWAGSGSHAHSSCGTSEGVAREMTEIPVDAGTSRINIEPQDCVNKTVLLQDHTRLRRLAANKAKLGGASGQHWEACQRQQSNCDCFQDVTVLDDEESDTDICPLQQCQQDVKVTCAIPVTCQWDVRLPCNILSKRRNNVSHLNTRSFPLRKLVTPSHVPACISTPPQSRKILGKQFKDRFNISPKAMKELPTTTSSSIRQGQSSETAVRCKTDSYSGIIKIEESPTMMLYIQKVQPSEIRVTRYTGQRVLSQQPGQHDQNPANANEPSIEEVKTSGQCERSKVCDESSAAQKVTYSHVTHTADTYNIASGAGSYVLDSALPPLPSFSETFNKRYSLLQENNADTLQKESSLGTSSCGMNEGPPLLPMSTTCAMPFAINTSGYMDDKETLLLLQNTAFESFSESRETKSNILSSHTRPQYKMTPEGNLTTSANISYQDLSVPHSQVSSQPISNIVQIGGVGSAGCIASAIQSEFSSTGGLQSQSGEGSFYFQGSQVVWTAQDPKFSIPNIIPNSENSEHLSNTLQSSGEHSFNLPQSLRKTEAVLQDKKDFHTEANLIAHMIDEYMSEDVHKSETGSVMQSHISEDSVSFMSGRKKVIPDENKKNVISAEGDTVNTHLSSKIYGTRDEQAQSPDEGRPLCEDEGTFTLPPALSDLMLDAEGELNNFTQSDQDYRLLPLCTFTGDEESNAKLGDEKSQQNLVSIGTGIGTFSASADACPKKPWFEHNNYNINDFNDLLDSLIQDADNEKNTNMEKVVKNTSHTSMEPTSFNVTTTREDNLIKEPTEYILKDTSRNKYAVGLKKGECWPKPLLSHMFDKDPGKDIAILVPVTASHHLHKSSSVNHHVDYLISNIGTSGKVPQTVTFKTRPAVSRSVTTTHRTQMQPTTSSCVSKGKQLQPQQDCNYLKILSKNSSGSYSLKKQNEISCKRPSAAILPASQNTSCCDVSEKAKLILPVGETGLSITIPKCTPVSITSFVVPTSPSCNVLNSKPISDHQWQGFISNSEGRIATSLPTTTALLKIKHPPYMNSKFCLQSGKKLDLSPAVINIGNAPATAEVIQLQSSMSSVLLTPIGEQPLMSCNAPPGNSTHTSSDPSVSGNGSNVIKKAVTKYCLQSTVHPHVSRNEKVQPAVCSSPSPPLCPKTVEEPVVIQINTKVCPKSSVASSSTIEAKPCGQGSLQRKTVEGLQRHIQKKKPYPDSIKSKKVLREDLKELLPSFPESVLNTLHLPPKAIQRGYFVVGELKALCNQALTIHLDTLFREHVCSCTSDSCPTCISFFEQKEALTQAERELRHTGKGKAGGKSKKQTRGKRKKSSWRYDSEDEDELFFRSPSPPLLKRKNTRCEESQYDDCKKVKCSNRKETSKMSSQLESKSKVWGKARMKHSTSDTELYLHRKEVVREDSRYSFDDSCLISYSLPLGLTTSHNHNLSSTPRRQMELLTRKEVPPKTKSHMYVLRSDQWASLSRVTLANSRLKLELKRGYVPYTEQQGRGESKTPCTRLSQNPLTMDVLSISIGAHIISSQEGPPCWPKLYVNFSDRKLVYAFSTRNQAVNGSEKDLSQIVNNKDKKESVMDQQHSPGITSQAQDETAPHPLICIDVPFTSLQALNINSNRVVVIVNALPSTYLMTCKEGCWTSFPRDHQVSQACQSRLALTKALLAVFPMHQLLLQHGKEQTLRDSLCEFSPWFKQILVRPFSVRSNHTPSWALPSPTVPVDLSSSTTMTSTSTLSFSSSSSLSYSSSQSTTAESVTLPSTVLPSTAPCSSQFVFTSSSSVASSPQPSTSSAMQEEAQQDGLHVAQTTNPVVCGAASFTASPALPTEVPVISAVRAALQAQGVMHALSIKLPLQYPPKLTLEKGCSCRGICRTVECPCARAGALCHPKQSCFCEECDNPLNVLHVLGIDMYSARMDECLVQNLYSYNVTGLCSLLASRVVLPCCGASPELLSIIPGMVTCTYCGMPVSYSWCSHHIHLQTLCPRNHCILCWCCKPVFHTHCQKCQQCTRSMLQGQCGECGSNKL